MDWKNNLTKTPFLILFVILISVGITSAYAINITLGGTVDITEILNMMGNKITNLGTPTADTDAATKGYVDSSIGGDSNLIGGRCVETNVPSVANHASYQFNCDVEGAAVDDVVVSTTVGSGCLVVVDSRVIPNSKVFFSLTNVCAGQTPDDTIVNVDYIVLKTSG